MFSIIVPSYNRNTEVLELLESLKAQTVYNFEVIIVDDCSPQTVVIEPNYPFEVKVFRNEINQGAAGSRNVGAQLASQEWLLFLDDDDRFANNKCEVISQYIEQHPQVNFIYHSAQCEMVNEKFQYFTRPIEPNKINLDHILLANRLGGMPMMGIKKSFFIALGGLNSELKSLEDYEFALKVADSPNLKAGFINQPLSICYFHTKRSSVSTNTENTEKAIEYIEHKYVKTEKQKQNFAINSLYILSYIYAMNLSHKAANYYFKIFKRSHNIKHFAIAIISFISPKLAINMKRFF